MLYEMKKAFEVLLHPGVDTNFLRMMKNAFPYYVNPTGNVPAPLTLYWSINSVCNMKCRMCDIGMKNRQGTFYKNLAIDSNLHEIDLKVFTSVIEELASAKPFIVFNSTEPLLYKHIAEAIQYCKERQLKTALTTNGYLLPEKAAKLANSGLNRLNISLDGPPSIHNEIRGRTDSFEKVREGIIEFSRSSSELHGDTKILVNFVITNMNYMYLNQFMNSIDEWPVDQINFTYFWFISPDNARQHNQVFGNVYPVSTSCYSEFINPDQVDIAVLWEQINQVKKRKNVHFLPYFSKPELNVYFHECHKFMNNNGRCLASWFFVQILADGNVIPHSRCHSESLGNINNQRFYEVWNGNRMKKWRRFIRKHKRMPMCKRCDLMY